MKQLSNDHLNELRRDRQWLNSVEILAQPELDQLMERWRARVEPDAHDECERFAVADRYGDATGASGPRWLFHLLGIRHRASHIGLTTPEGMVILQRRSATRIDWPSAWDMAAAGHVPDLEDGGSMTFEEGAMKEVGEELGLPEEDIPDLLAEGALLPIGEPYLAFDRDEGRNPPFHNAESRQLYGATLTMEGLARLRPDYEEVSGVYICSQEEAWDILAREPIASGLRYSLPRFLDWLAKRQV